MRCPVPKEWVDKSIEELQVRRKHHVNILAIRDGGEGRPDGQSHLPVYRPRRASLFWAATKR